MRTGQPAEVTPPPTHAADRSPRPRRTLVVIAIALGLAGCGDESPAGPQLPDPGAVPDYQLGGAYEPRAEVGIVVRDRTAEPDPQRYSICYVNGFQTQPGELDTWPRELLLLAGGVPVADPNWPDEMILDTSTPARVAGIAAVVEPWIAGCAAAGFDAVELDNLDTFSRVEGLTLEGNLALASELVEIGHRHGLAVGQKNAAEHAARFREDAGFDFAVAETCHRYDECAAYTDAYGDQVIMIEYADDGYGEADFGDACAGPAGDLSLVLRDRLLVAPDGPGYVFESCPR